MMQTKIFEIFYTAKLKKNNKKTKQKQSRETEKKPNKRNGTLHTTEKIEVYCNFWCSHVNEMKIHRLPK